MLLEKVANDILICVVPQNRERNCERKQGEEKGEMF